MAERYEETARGMLGPIFLHFLPECSCEDGDPSCPIYGYNDIEQALEARIATALAAAVEEARKERLPCLATRCTDTATRSYAVCYSHRQTLAAAEGE